MRSVYFLFLLLLLLLAGNGYGQAPACPPNIDFEQGNFANWKLYTGTCCPVSANTLGQAAGRHTLMSGTANDLYGGFPVVAPGSGTYSLKLGNNGSGSQAERARYYIHVPAGTSNYSIVYRYAVVLEDPSHTPSDQPRFEVKAYDSATGALVACAQHTYVASSSLPGFQLSTMGNNVYYKSWTTNSLNLSGKAGTTIAVDFSTADCGLGAHFGYGYVDMNCGLFQISGANCTGGTTTALSAPPGFAQYQWMDSTFTTTLGTGQSVNLAVPAVNTKIYVILTPYTGFGCPDTLTTRISISNLSIVSKPDTILCHGAALQLGAGDISNALPHSYSWTGPGLSCTSCATPVVTSAALSGIYTVAVTDAIGCTKRDTFSVGVSGQASIAVNKVLCYGGSTGGAALTMQGSVPASSYTYAWNTLPVQTGPAITGQPAGQRTVIITDAVNNCTRSLSVNIPQPAGPLSLTAGNVNGACPGLTNGSAVAVAAGGTVPYTYQWNAGPVQPGGILSNASAGTYTIKVTDSAGCDTTLPVVLPLLPSPQVSAGKDTVLCGSNTYQLQGTGGDSYTWSPAAGLSCTNCSAPFASFTGLRSYRVIGRNAAGCPDTAQVSIALYPAPQVAAGRDTSICGGIQYTLQATGASTYVWSPATGLSCVNCSSPVVSGLVGSRLYTVIGQNTYGCADTSSVTIALLPSPELHVTDDTTACGATSFQLHASGAGDYTWSPAAGLSCTNCPDPVAYFEGTRRYLVTGAFANGCVDTESVLLTLYPRVPVSVGPAVDLCAGEEGNLRATGGVAYSWSPVTGLSDPDVAAPRVSPDSSRKYRVIITENPCFKDTLYQMVRRHPLPRVDAGRSFGAMPGAVVVLSATVQGASTVAWLPVEGVSCPVCPETQVVVGQTTTYNITATTDKGCTASDTVTIKAICDGALFYIANTFTPNGDGENDRFYPQGKGVGLISHFRVYNRWGETVFAADNMRGNDENVGWDGTFQGQPLKPDVFVYVAEARCNDGQSVTVRGDISLIR